MANEKTYVKVESTKSGSDQVHGNDSRGKMVKVEQKWDPKKRARIRRVLAILFRLIAITFEVIWILRLTDVISWFSSLDITTFLLICLGLDLLFFIPGSLLWKKANHIDPASEKNKTKFWIWNNLGTILSVLAFLPIIIFVLADKDLDKKSKSIVTTVAVVALAIAWISSYDFNPVSIEQLNAARAEILANENYDTNEDGEPVVYWLKNSKKYHINSGCQHINRKGTTDKMMYGTIEAAFENGLTEPCRTCIKAIEKKTEEAENIESEDEENDLEWVVWELVEWLMK